MDMYYSTEAKKTEALAKKAEALRKKQLKLNKDKQFAEANSVLVHLLIPPTTHRDELRLMPEQELVKLKPVELVKQALLLMTSGDPHGLAACGGAMAVDQCIAAMAALTTRANKRLIDKMLHEKEDELKAVAEVDNFMNATHQDIIGGDINEDADDDSDSDPADDADDNISDNLDDYLEVIDRVDNSSSSRVPPAVSTLGAETTMGRDIQRPVDKRPSKRTPMLGQYHGKEHFPVLPSGFNPQQRISNKSKNQAAGQQAILLLRCHQISLANLLCCHRIPLARPLVTILEDPTRH